MNLYSNWIFNIPVFEWVKQVSQNCYFVEGEMLCYVHHPKLLIFFHWLNLQCTYIQMQQAHMFCYTTICNGIWTKMVGMNEVDCTIGLSLEWLINWCMVWYYNHSKHFTCTKHMAHKNISTLLFLTTVYYKSITSNNTASIWHTPNL